MAAADATTLEHEFLAGQELVAKQGDIVRSLKANLKDGKVERVGLFFFSGALRRHARGSTCRPPTCAAAAVGRRRGDCQA
jgi:hypothetical protein